MGHKKLIRFEAIKHFDNVFEMPENMQGQWNTFFKNNNPITLELACGKGEYTTGLAKLYPQRNFIGIDVKGNRIWAGAKRALDEGLSNVAFLRTQIDHIQKYFSKNEIEEIWITFPDPFLRSSKEKKRLTHTKFLKFYQSFLIPEGKIHLKTDSPVLYEFTKEMIVVNNCTLKSDRDDLASSENLSPELQIQTYYQSLDIAKSKKIYYLCFTLPNKIPN